MFRLPLTSWGPSLFPQSRSALGGFRSSASTSSVPRYIHSLTPAPPPFYPWCIARAVPPRPQLPPARFVYSGRFLGANVRPFCSSNELTMERPDREREPPPKRRKSSEERQKGMSSKTETREERTNYHYKDRNRDLREKNPPGKHLSREASREKDVERTKKGGEVKTQQRTLAKHERSKTSQSKGGKEEEKMEEGQSSKPWSVVGADKQTTSAGSLSTKPLHTVSVKSLQRHWELSPLCCTDEPRPPGVSAGFDFTVMSYNILSQDLLLDNSYLYRHCEPAVLQWDFRLHNILREIQTYHADILCLQEVQEDHFVNQLRPALETLGYQCEYKKRTGHKSDGCAVAFKSSRLSLLSSNPVEFFRRGDSLLDRDNVGLVLRLRPVSEPSSSLCVANTHLLYNPRRGDIKLAQLAILLAEVSRLSRLPDGSANPVLLCGDFNSTPWSPLYRFLMTGHLDFKGLPIGMVSGQESTSRGQRLLPSPLWSKSLGITSSCQYQDRAQDRTHQAQTAEPSSSSPTAVGGAISELAVDDLTTKAAEEILNRWTIKHSLKLQSSYNHRLSPDGRAEITTCHSRTAMTVDYILYTPDLPVAPVAPSPSPSLPGGRGLQLLSRLSLVGRSELEQVNGLPNQNHSSDHLPLLARFRLQR